MFHERIAFFTISARLDVSPLSKPRNHLEPKQNLPFFTDLDVHDKIASRLDDSYLIKGPLLMNRQLASLIISTLLCICGVAQSASAQQLDSRTFSDVTIKTVRPDELGGNIPLENPADLLNPVLESTLIELDIDEREALRARVASNVVEVVALHMPPKPYEQIPMIYRGHAVWLSTQDDGSDPVLISTLSWLQDAREIYIIPRDTKKTSKKKEKARDTRIGEGAQLRTLEQVSSGKEAWRAFKKKKKDYVRVTPKNEDSMRGLVWLTTDAKGTPAKGLPLIPEDTKTLNFLFGYTHLLPEIIADVVLAPSRSDVEAISFYFLNSYQATLGAPVFNEKGQVIMLNALPNPSDAQSTLAIPPGALRDYITSIQTKK